MTPTVPPGLDLVRIKTLYEWAEQRYLESLPLEHFMESTAQSTQRQITVDSFTLIAVHRPEVQCFSELLVQYPRPGHNPDKPGQVVPDNMVLIHHEPIKAMGSFMTPLQPAMPFLVLEYVSKFNKRKDYEVNYERYEQELQVPYYLLFYPEADEFTLFHLVDGKYVTVRPNEAGRYAIAELELEAGLYEGWVRYWFRGELLPLPGELLLRLNAASAGRRKAEEQAANAEAARARAEERAATIDAELTRLKEELSRLKGQP